MTKLTRQRLSVWLCLFLTTFLLCQGMAKAAGLLLTPPPVVAPTESFSCHSSSDSTPSPTPDDCHLQCQHLDKAYSADLPSSLWEHAPLAFFVLPPLQGYSGSTITLATLSWHDPPSKPPIPIRLQRFLK